MALYDFKCSECGHIFERSLKIKDRKTPESEPCPECGEMKVTSVILQAVQMADPCRIGITKIPQGFTDVLKQVKKGNKNSTINIRGN